MIYWLIVMEYVINTNSRHTKVWFFILLAWAVVTIFSQVYSPWKLKSRELMLLIAGLKVDAPITWLLGCPLNFVVGVLEDEGLKLRCCSFGKNVTFNRFASIR
jgi:predicted membrane channel-forming protein YqfA (hemolysin III family)